MFPRRTSRLVRSPAAFERLFDGSHDFTPEGSHQGSYLPYAVEGFFVQLGVAPVKPAEFVVLRVERDTAGGA